MQHSRKVNVLLVGLEEALAEELGGTLCKEGQAVFTGSGSSSADCSRAIIRTDPDIVFCPAVPNRFRIILESVRRVRPGLPLVVVSRFPEVSEWLDAMEAGASDYFASPFEPAQVRWILESNLSRACAAVA